MVMSMVRLLIFLSFLFSPLLAAYDGVCNGFERNDDLVTPHEKEVLYIGGDIRVIGEARGLDKGELLYCEIHYQLDNGNKRVDYYEGKTLIARKLLGKTDLISQPWLYQYDLRSGEIRHTAIQPSTDKMLILYQDNKSSKVKQKEVSLADDLIVDAGFSAYVIQNWQHLIEGKELVFDFASPVHKRAVGLRALNESLSKCDDMQPESGGQHYCFSVSIDNALLRLIVGELKTVYSEDKRIQFFKGAVNIENKKGKRQKAKVAYFYP